VEVLPNGLDGERLGIDDLIHRHGAEVFHRIAKIARSPFKLVGRGREKERVWAFEPEPRDTYERNIYLHGLIGRHWRSSNDAKDHWQRWTSTHWETVAGDDELLKEVEHFADLQGWQNRELGVIRSLSAAFRRAVRSASRRQKRGLLPF